MGTWESERGHVSDEMADILGEAFGKIGALSREPTMIDLADAIEFVSRGSFRVELHPAADKLGNMPVAYIAKGCCFETIPNRGQIR